MNRDEYKKERKCRVSVLKRHLIYALFLKEKLHILRGLPGLQFIPVTVIAN
jgi:hypothetical protein